MSRFSNIPMGKGGFDVQPLPWPPVNLKFFAFPVTLCIFVYSQWRNMEKYVVSARKYRPTTFKSIVGQHALTKTLKNAVQTGRLAHSYLFCGQRGVGKTTTARIFAKAINCEHLTADGEPCNECESCALTDQVLVPPITGRYRVFIIDEVHMLSQAAFNAFLKTLEEPPSYVIFILATTEKQKILPTILSRCQKYDFQSITPADIAEQLQYVADHEGYATEPAGLNVIAQKSDGAMRDALSRFEELVPQGVSKLYLLGSMSELGLARHRHHTLEQPVGVFRQNSAAAIVFRPDDYGVETPSPADFAGKNALTVFICRRHRGAHDGIYVYKKYFAYCQQRQHYQQRRQNARQNFASRFFHFTVSS